MLNINKTLDYFNKKLKKLGDMYKENFILRLIKLLEVHVDQINMLYIFKMDQQ